MVEWLAGNRIRGTSAEKPVLGLQSPSVGGWVEVGRFTASGAVSSMPVTSLSDKRYYMYLSHYTSNADGQRIEINSDTGSNYSQRFSTNGASDSTGINQSNIVAGYGGSGLEEFNVGYIANKSDKEKLTQTFASSYGASGAGTAPNRRECTGKWANTSAAISSFDFKPATSTFQSGAEVVVLGWDPADTHTTNFWEELASVTLGSAGSTIDSGTITAKKYLWFQIFNGGLSSSGVTGIRFNSDGSNNYAERRSGNGGSDVTGTSRPVLNLVHTGTNTPQFSNCFVINNSSNEKLVISHSVSQNTAGAGTAPNRSECADKWANTSSQITSVQAIASVGNFPSGSILKVWGSN